MHKKNIIARGKSLKEASQVLIMIHGRGAHAEDILSLSSYFNVKDFALLAPQATNNTWYPYSFMAPTAQNEPWLSSALSLLKEIAEDINQEGIASGNIYFLGFSQGACLTLEFIAQHATKWGGIAAFTGGLIGDKIDRKNYTGDFENTPVFIGSSNPDPHVPIERVYATTNILKEMNAHVEEKIYNHMGHTINEDEINLVNNYLFK